MEQIIRNADGTVTIDGKVFKQVEEEKWPKYGDEYWLIAGYGEVEHTVWYDSASDRMYMNIENVFKTEEEAKRALRLLKIKAKINRWKEENDPGEKDIPWDGRWHHFGFVLRTKTGELVIREDCWYKKCSFYFSTNEIAEKCIQEFRDDLIWYFQNC